MDTLEKKVWARTTMGALSRSLLGVSETEVDFRAANNTSHSTVYPLGPHVIQWVPQLFEQLESLHVNKSCKIECCSNKMRQTV